MKSYCRFNLLGVCVFNFEHLDILRDSIEHPSKKLFSLEFAQCLCLQFRASRFITRLNRTSELKAIALCICYELPISITSVSIHYGSQSDIREKSYCRLNLLRASIFNSKRPEIFRDTIKYPSKRLFWFAFARNFYI